LPLDQGDRLAADGLTSPDRINAFTGFGLDVDPIWSKPQELGDALAYLALETTQLRLLGKNDHIYVDNFPTSPVQAVQGVLQEFGRVSVCVGWISIGKRISDVAQTGRTEQGVGHSVEHNVRVAVPGQAGRVGNAHAPEDQWTPRCQSVRIMSDPDAHNPSKLAKAARKRLNCSVVDARETTGVPTPA
jgi:hypothetical protein